MPIAGDETRAQAEALTPGEIDRLIEGRYDWREGRWQDHCGDLECPHCDGMIPEGQPHMLSAEDQALRQHLMETNNVER